MQYKSVHIGIIRPSHKMLRSVMPDRGGGLGKRLYPMLFYSFLLPKYIPVANIIYTCAAGSLVTGVPKQVLRMGAMRQCWLVSGSLCPVCISTLPS